jgi:hypothetical protein
VLVGLAASFIVGRHAWDAAASGVAAIVLVDLGRALPRGVLGAIMIALMVGSGGALEPFAAARARRQLAALIGPHATRGASMAIMHYA